MVMKVMFLDESGDHSLDKIDRSYPMFVLAGCIFDLDYYSEVEKRVNEFKLKHCTRTDIILRSYDIRKQRGDFNFLVDKKKRDYFYEDLNQLISSLNFTVIAAAIDKARLKNQYVDPDNPYHLCLRFILERAVMHLGRTKEKMIFRIESRETHNDRKLAEIYENFRKKDQAFFKAIETQAKFIDLSFNQKTQNVVGIQIADLVAYPIGRWVIDNQKENKSFEIVQPKIHKNPRSLAFLNYGLKVFP